MPQVRLLPRYALTVAQQRMHGTVSLCEMVCHDRFGTQQNSEAEITRDTCHEAHKSSELKVDKVLQRAGAPVP